MTMGRATMKPLRSLIEAIIGLRAVAMTLAQSQPLTLTQFLALPDIEASPAWEYEPGRASQKPMPGGKHSRLQSRLVGAINAVDSAYEALPELRCTVAGRSMVPDVTVLEQAHIPVDDQGDIISAGIEFAPPWMVEILSPDQSQMKVTRKILHSLRHGGQLGWLIDPDDRVVLIYQPDHLPEERVGQDLLPVLPGLDLVLSADDLFRWLRLGDR